MTADGPEEKDLLSRSPFGVSASICMGMREGTRESKSQTPNIGSSDESRRLPIDLHVKRSFCVIRVVSGCVLEYINEGGHCAIMTKVLSHTYPVQSPKRSMRHCGATQKRKLTLLHTWRREQDTEVVSSVYVANKPKPQFLGALYYISNSKHQNTTFHHVLAFLNHF